MRFQTKLLIAFAFFFALAVALMLVISLQSQQRIIRTVDTDLQNVMRTVHSTTGKLSSENTRDVDHLIRFINDAKRDNSAVKEVSIVSRSKEIVASSNPKMVGKLQQ